MHHLPFRYIPCDGRLTASAYFNPRSPQGKRHVGENVDNSIYGFQSTLPAWGATGAKSTEKAKAVISIHAPRMGSDKLHDPTEKELKISIHAPRMRSDKLHDPTEKELKISIHAPRMRSDAQLTRLKDESSLFQSTLPAWGATYTHAQTTARAKISIHAPRMGSDPHWIKCHQYYHISIHAPRMGSDASRRSDNGQMFVDFNPRSPHGERQYSQSIQQ